MSRPARARINARALQHNLLQVKHHAPSARIMAVVKANGYGHGMIQVAQALSEADAFAVASLEEAAQLRKADIKHPITLLSGFFREDELAELANLDLAPVIHDNRQVALMQQYSGKPVGKPIKNLWLKIDTGMHRLGLMPEQAKAALESLQQCAAIEQIGIMSHLANADDTADDKTAEQLENFRQFTESFSLPCSLANSAGVLAWPETHFDWVRPGIMLYGAAPLASRTAQESGLRAVMTLESEIISIKPCRKGDAIGYGGGGICPQDMNIGVIAIGYGDGYPRHAPSGTPVIINGVRAPLIGRVSMDLITVDLRNIPEAQAGDWAELWGEALPVDEVAQYADTIGYELLCAVSGRVPRLLFS